MERIYEWLRDLVGFFLFVSVIDHLLPGKAYQKYIRLFSGIVLILLVVQPFTGGLELEEMIARWYESFVFQYEASELDEDLLGIEAQRLADIISQYEEAVAMDVAQMAREEGLEVKGCQAAIAGDTEGADFGQVTGIRLELWKEGEGEETEGGAGGLAAGADGQTPAGMAERSSAGGSGMSEGIDPVTPVTPVEPVQIGAGADETGADGGVGNGTLADGTGPEQPDPAVSDSALAALEPIREALARLRRKIAAYYGLEEQYVEIQVVERQG